MKRSAILLAAIMGGLFASCNDDPATPQYVAPAPSRYVFTVELVEQCDTLVIDFASLLIDSTTARAPVAARIYNGRKTALVEVEF